MTCEVTRSRRLAVLAIALVSVLVACRVGPNYRVPALPQDAETLLVPPDSELDGTTPTPNAWWHLYNDAQLDRLVQEALQANHELAAAEAHFAAARAAASGVHAYRYPSTEIGADATRGRDPTTEEILEFGGHPPRTISLYEDVFHAAYELDLFGHVHRAIEAADANAEAEAAARDGVRVVVAAETARTYAAVCALGEELDVAHHSFDVVSHEARIALRQYEAGGGSQYDVKRAQALSDQVRATIPELEGERQSELFALTALLGRTPAHAPKQIETCTTPPRLSSLIPVGDGGALIRRRPDVREAERRLAASTAEIGVATAELFPIVHLGAFFGGAAPEVPELNTNVGRIWGIGPSISWTFPNQAGPRARVRQAKASQVAALASFDSTVLTALKEVEQTLTTYGSDLANRRTLASAQANVQGAFDIARDGYEAGSLSTLDLLTTEQTLVSLDAAVASADTRLVQDQIAIFKALGGGWQE